MSGSEQIEAMDVEEMFEDGQGGAGLEDQAKASGEKWGAPMRNKEDEWWAPVRNNETKEASKGNEGKWGSVRWLEQCSKHLAHIEVRAMEQHYLGHEVVRMISTVLVTYCPPSGGGLGMGHAAGL